MASRSNVTPCRTCLVSASNGKKWRCALCDQLVDQARNRPRITRISSNIANSSIRQSSGLHRQLYPNQAPGYACHYSGIELCTDKSCHRQGDYASFDHVVPQDPNKIVLCSRIVNDLKGWMTDDEFRGFVCQCLDVKAMHKLPHLNYEQTRRFLVTLQSIMLSKRNRTVPRRLELSALKSLSAKIRYARAESVANPKSADN
jgi:hypothetical protein